MPKRLYHKPKSDKIDFDETMNFYDFFLSWWCLSYSIPVECGIYIYIVI